ncbi:hypothetical protein NDU88_003277 [Pleurodeles waltl]|uniref:Uncharacterized protein n=1 Tax=Pleurodeles waltl TaxID=8319 RepID=A0AAV7KY06_PLEWA|nr:hypothetical protein NDU88_003277 [Pleurodeles waltl]
MQPGGTPWKTDAGTGLGARQPPLMTGGGAIFPLKEERSHGEEAARLHFGPGGPTFLPVMGGGWGSA